MMVVARDVKKWLEPLAARHADLAVVGRLLIVTPVRHHLRAVLIDRTSSANCITPRWFIHHLFSPRLGYHLSWGELLSGRTGHYWNTDEPGMPAELLAVIETQALPILRSINSLDDLKSTVMERWNGHHLVNNQFTKVVIDLAFGNVEAAQGLCKTTICDYPQPGPQEADVTKMRIAGAKLLCELLNAGDINGGIRKLHDWERETATKLKLSQHWEPTPFPVELKMQAR